MYVHDEGMCCVPAWPRCLPPRSRQPIYPAPPHPQLGVYLADDPVLCAWRGATLLAASPSYPRLAVSQKEWRSRGVGALAKWDQ